MSIFRESFKPEIKTQLKKREDAMLNRTTENIQYINSRNAWIRMASSVNVNGKADLAQAYVLHGGTLNDGSGSNWSFKTGIGETGREAYSTKTPYGTTHKLGIRPMPGITSIDVKSKSAYGSLREVTVNFQCWDIRQLEELELLYMRPGYTVLVEWGWVPYFKPDPKNPGDFTKCTYQYTFNDFYSDTLLSTPPSERSAIFKKLYDQSITYGGNYDAMFGYVKNYNWSARPDGGYDCQTIIISTGEIIESLKVNYVRPDLQTYGIYDTNGKGFLDDLVADAGVTTDKYRSAYEKNTLAGIWTELYYKFSAGGGYRNSNIKDWVKVPLPGTVNADDSMIDLGSSDRVYITLENVFSMLNEYIIAKDSNEELIRLSVKTNTYSSNGEPLTCVAHPLQVSTDPLVCLIKNTVWEKTILSAVVSNTQNQLNNVQTIADDIAKELVEASDDNVQGSYKVDVDRFINAIKRIDGTNYVLINDKFKAGVKSISNTNFQYNEGLAGLISEQFVKDDNTKNNLKSPTPLTKKDNNNSIVQIGGDIKALWWIYQMKQFLNTVGLVLDIALTDTTNTLPSKNLSDLVATTTPNIYFDNITVQTSTTPPKTESIVKLDFTSIGQAIFTIQALRYTLSSTVTLTSTNTQQQQQVNTFIFNSQDAVDCMKKINMVSKEYFLNGNSKKEIGEIGNIYVCLDFLYKLAISGQMESQDSKEKQEINLYSYIKNIASGINAALGSVSNFEVHVDPVDNIGRIIDVNYCEPDKKALSLHEFNIQTLDSVIRNFKLESKIFPNQSAIIAIGAQASGGQLGIQNNTMVDYNHTLTDRVLGDKTFPKKTNALSQYKNKAKPDMAAGLASIVFLLATMNTAPALGAQSQLKNASSKARSGLRDLIVYFQNITTSPSANRNIIPTKLSFEMDGIGGLVIGQLFKIDQNILPRGYKGLKGGSSEIAQTITGISHKIDNGDWTTSIDSLMIILDDIISGFGSLDIASIVSAAVQTVINQSSTPAPAPPGTPPPTPPGQITNVNPGKKDPAAGTVHKIKDQSLIDFMLTHVSKKTGMDAKTRNLKNVRQIVLHHTNGYGNGLETMKGMQNNKMYDKQGVYIGDRSFWCGIHYAIDMGGGIAEGVPLDKIVIHADNYNDTAVGIEICNIGALIDMGGGIFAPKATPKKHFKEDSNKNPLNSSYVPHAYLPSLANLNRPSGWGGEVVDMTFKWVDYQYYLDYTDIQIAALKKTIEEILGQCPNIKLNYDKNSFSSIYYNIFGIEECKNGALPIRGGSYKPTRNIPRFDGTNRGIVIHGTSPGGDHYDTHPSSKMLNMLKTINWPADNLNPKIF